MFIEIYSHTLSCTLLKCTTHEFLVIPQSYTTITTNSRTFLSLKKKHIPVVATPYFPLLSPWQSQIYFLSLLTCLFWIFHRNAIIKFYVWLLSLSIMCLKFIYVIASISTSFLFMAQYFILWVGHILFIQELVDRLACFDFGATINIVARQICAQIVRYI